MKYDGSIIISTGIDTEGIDKGKKEIAQKAKKIQSDVSGIDMGDIDAEKALSKIIASLKSFGGKVNGTLEKVFAIDTQHISDTEDKVQGITSAVDNLDEKSRSTFNKQLQTLVKQKAHYQEQIQKIDSLKSKISELSDKKIKTEEYQYWEKELEKINKTIDSTIEKQNALGNSKGDTAKSKTYDGKIKELQQAHASTMQILKEIESEGGAFKPVDTSQLESSLKKAENDLKSTKINIETTKESMRNTLDSAVPSAEVGGVERFGESIENLKTKMSTLASEGIGALKKGIGTVGSAAKTGAKKIFGLGSSAKSSGENFLGSAKKMLKYALGIRGIFALVKKLKNAFKDGAGPLAKYDGEFNKSISNIVSAFNNLKNTLVTTFAPIVNVISPILTKFLNLLTSVMNKIGQFFSALTGKNTFIQAKKNYTDYASSVEDSTEKTEKNTKALKENEKQLSGLDEMNRWQSDKDKDAGSSGGNKGNNVEYETVGIKKSIGNLAKKIKKLINKDDWEGVGKLIANKLNGTLKSIPWSGIQNTLKGWVSKIARLLNGFFSVMDLASTVGNTIAQALNTALIGAYTFVTTFNFSQFGKWIGTALTSAIQNFKWGMLGDTLGGILQGAIDTAYEFVNTYPWGELASGLSKTINHFFKSIKWGKAGKTVGQAIIGIFEEISTFLSKVKWEKIGKSIGTFLSSIDWYGIVKKLFGIIVKAVKACFKVIISTLKGLVEKGIDPVEGVFLALGVTIASLKLTGVILKLYDMYKKFILLSNGEKIATVTTKLFGTAVNMSLGKVLLIITAVGALIGIFAKLVTSHSKAKSSTDELNSKMEKTQQKAKEVKEAMDEARKQTEEAFATITVEYDELDTYKNKLAGITDESGKIKAGHEAEAQAIIDTLNPALGLSLEIVKGQVKGYENVNKAIDETIAKKELEAKKDAMQAEYDEAINNRAQAYENVNNAMEAVDKKQEEYNKKLEVYNTLKANPMETSDYSNQLRKAEEDLNKADKALGKAKTQQEEYQGEMKNINNTITEYMTMSDALLSGNADNIKETLTRVNNGIVKTSDATLAELQENEKKVQEKYDKLKAMKADGIAVSSSELKETRQALKIAKDDVNTFTDNLVKTATESRKKGKNITQGTGKGMEDGLPGLQKVAEGMKGKVLGFITSAFGIHSPAKTTQPHGKYIVQGIGKGMEDEIKGNAIKSVLNLLRTTIKEDVQGMFAKKEWVFSGVSEGLEETFSSVGNKIKEPISKIIGYLNTMISGIETTINSCIKALNGLDIKFPAKAVKLAKKSGVDLSGSLGLNLEAINLQKIPVPHLATGAVIPPRSEFMAVLGDQKNGNNIEAPESLIRKIVREETATNRNGGTYQFVGQINRRTLFEEFIKEAKLQKKLTGTNPLNV